jgi:hypothetical protein
MICSEPDEKLLAVKNWRSLDLIKVRERTCCNPCLFQKRRRSNRIGLGRQRQTVYVSEAEDRIRVAELEDKHHALGESLVCRG